MEQEIITGFMVYSEANGIKKELLFTGIEKYAQEYIEGLEKSTKIFDHMAKNKYYYEPYSFTYTFRA